jgi:hypothetical protein
VSPAALNRAAVSARSFLFHQLGQTHRQQMARKKPKFDVKKEIRKLARERVGTVPSARVIVPKLERKKTKHKKPIAEDQA